MSIILFSSAIVVNTVPSKNVSWRIKNVGSEHKDGDFDPEFIERLREAVLRLPTRVSLPRFVSQLSLPRYYLIVLGDLDALEVREIVGVRGDMSPTKWSYRLGYWHPSCQFRIARSLEYVLKQLSQLQQPTV
jgi:hypothetical protein